MRCRPPSSVLEDSPHFNAGYGAALTETGQHELDASIMDGATLNAGAVAGVRRIRNPVACARAVLDSGRAVLLMGAAADRFAESAGLAMVPPDYFTTQRRIDALASLKQRAAFGHISRSALRLRSMARSARWRATSTGIWRRPHRLAGSTTSRRAVSATARSSVPAPMRGTVSARCPARDRARSSSAAWRPMMLPRACSMARQSLQEAAQTLVFDTLRSHNIGAGMIVLGATGEPLAPFNTLGMYRGWITTDGMMTVGTHQEVYHLGPVT